jgi:hypothetical protein
MSVVFIDRSGQVFEYVEERPKRRLIFKRFIQTPIATISFPNKL